MAKQLYRFKMDSHKGANSDLILNNKEGNVDKVCNIERRPIRTSLADETLIMWCTSRRQA